MEAKDKIKALRGQTGLSQVKFGMMFNIAPINIANWEQGITSPPEYVQYMLERLIEIDPLVPHAKQEEEVDTDVKE